MRSDLKTPELVGLLFYPMPPMGKTTCLVTDGVTYRVGWWSSADRCLYVPNADGSNGVFDHRDIIAWAKLPNYFGAIESRA